MGMGIALATGKLQRQEGRGIGSGTAPRDGSEPGFELGEALTEKCKLLLKVRELLLGGHGVQPALAASVSPRWTMPLHAVTLASAIFGSEFSGQNDSRMTQEKKGTTQEKVKSTAPALDFKWREKRWQIVRSVVEAAHRSHAPSIARR